MLGEVGDGVKKLLCNIFKYYMNYHNKQYGGTKLSIKQQNGEEPETWVPAHYEPKQKYSICITLFVYYAGFAYSSYCVYYACFFYIYSYDSLFYEFRPSLT